MKEKNNMAQYPQIFYAKCMVEGVCGYEDENILIGNNTLKAMSKSFIGKPVIVFHKDGILDPKTAEEYAEGYVIDYFYNELDGWFWVKMLVKTDEALEKIRSGWSVSTSYIPTEFGASGTRNSVQYDREVLEASYTHLAIVPTPRYEQARIFTPEEFKNYQGDLQYQLAELKNSKQKGDGLMFWKKQKVDNVDDAESTFVTLNNGKDISVKEMIDGLEKKNAEEEKKKEESKKDEKDMDAKYNVCGKEMTLKEILSSYESMCKEKENEESDEEKKKKEDEEKKNAEEEDKKKAEEEDEKKKEEEEKKNAKGKEDFDEIKKSMSKDNGAETSPNYETSSEQLERGKNLY